MSGENTKLNWSVTRIVNRLSAGWTGPTQPLPNGYHRLSPLRYNRWNITLAIQPHPVYSYATTTTGLHGVVLNPYPANVENRVSS